ncbi:MAG TPA: response regulator [Chloroflexia bacterium]|nr:response regulator [Chloroflexia bacterium]
MKRVLVIEDSHNHSQVLRYNLEEQNYQVVVITDRCEAYQALEENKPDLIVLDFCVADNESIELCKSFKKSNRFFDTPVIVFSSENNLRFMLKAYEAGADYYIVKDEEGNKVLRVLADSIFTRRSRPRLSLTA